MDQAYRHNHGVENIPTGLEKFPLIGFAKESDGQLNKKKKRDSKIDNENDAYQPWIQIIGVDSDHHS